MFLKLKIYVWEIRMISLKGVYQGKIHLDLIMCVLKVYMDKRVISGLDLRGQSLKITQSGYLNIQWNGENPTRCIGLGYCDPLVSYLLNVFIHSFSCVLNLNYIKQM